MKLNVLASPQLDRSPVLTSGNQPTQNRVAYLLNYCKDVKSQGHTLLTVTADPCEYNKRTAAEFQRFAEITKFRLPKGLSLDKLLEVAIAFSDNNSSEDRMLTVHTVRKEAIARKGDFEREVPTYVTLSYLRIFDYVHEMTPSLRVLSPIFIKIPTQLQKSMKEVQGVLLVATDVQGMYLLLGVKKQKVDENTDKTVVEPVLAFDLQKLRI